MVGLVLCFTPRAIINDCDESNLYFKAIHAVTGCYSLSVSSFYHFPLAIVMTIFSDTHPKLTLGCMGKFSTLTSFQCNSIVILIVDEIYTKSIIIALY